MVNSLNMEIRLSSPALLKITWPLYDPAIEQGIKSRLSTVPGIEAGHGRIAWAPVIQLARLTEIFPKASIDYAAMQQADSLGRRFYDMLVCLHVDLQIDLFGAVVALGDNASPLLQTLVLERSHALRPFVMEAVANPKPPVRRSPQPAIDVQYPKRRRPKKQRTKA